MRTITYDPRQTRPNLHVCEVYAHEGHCEHEPRAARDWIRDFVRDYLARGGQV